MLTGCLSQNASKPIFIQFTEVGRCGGHGVHVQSAVTQVRGQGHAAAPIPALSMEVTLVVEETLIQSRAQWHHVQVSKPFIKQLRNTKYSRLQ